MNILNITTMTEWRGGDAQMYTGFKLLEEYKDLNQIILCPDTSVLAKKCIEDNSKHYTYSKTSGIFSLIKPIIRICRKEKVDLIHVHDSNSLTATLLASIFLPSKTKIVLSRKRNNKIKDKFLNRYKYSHPKITKIISVSKAVEAIFDNIIKDKSKLVTIYDAIDVSFFSKNRSNELIHTEFSLPKETIIIGNVAALTSQKDIFTFIDTAREIMDKKPVNLSLKFVVIGDGSQRAELEKHASIRNLEDDIIFMGFRNNIQELLPEFDIFLLTSLTEGLPLTIYEAFATKIPVVATNAGGIAEVIENGQTGFVTNLKDTENLAKGVLKILNDKQLAETIKANAFELVSKNHDLNVMKQNYYSFYSSLK
ncbi:glycosyltransferase family 4 protein [Flavobacterium undicola]|uniref:glycosyltransferase family 4 protein n=1 Tax=Flavobacterium undicola TaxID=1932779 RepID=UPI00137674DA|nr:glycosyltransferase family 4 protein [Flavobacterium undicola]MBA0883710.1 glycosyltransferase family 4 protein [Flavobacterium undicola]